MSQTPHHHRSCADRRRADVRTAEPPGPRQALVDALALGPAPTVRRERAAAGVSAVVLAAAVVLLARAQELTAAVAVAAVGAAYLAVRLAVAARRERGRRGGAA